VDLHQRGGIIQVWWGENMPMDGTVFADTL